MAWAQPHEAGAIQLACKTRLEIYSHGRYDAQGFDNAHPSGSRFRKVRTSKVAVIVRQDFMTAGHGVEGPNRLLSREGTCKNTAGHH